MARFGERFGGRTIPLLKPDEVSAGFATGIWNSAESWLFDDTSRSVYERRMRRLYDHFGIPTDTIPYHDVDARKAMRPLFLNGREDWIRFYEYVELLPELFELGYVDDRYSTSSQNRHARQMLRSSMERDLTRVLEREGSPYRFVNHELALVTSKSEIAEIERAALTNDEFAAARAHIDSAIGHFAARPPAFADSIKQSVSALESVLEIATGVGAGDMTAQLRAFRQKYGLHGALGGAIEKLYGYASDEAGVRHGSGDPVSVGEREARLVLVACSALLNFVADVARPK